MKAYTIQNGRIPLHHWIDDNGGSPILVSTGALVPSCMNGETLFVLDWRIDHATGTVALDYQTRDSLTAPVHSDSVPLFTDHSPIAKPSRSPNWTWNDFWHQWHNSKTGARVTPFVP